MCHEAHQHRQAGGRDSFGQGGANIENGREPQLDLKMTLWLMLSSYSSKRRYLRFTHTVLVEALAIQLAGFL